MEMITRKTEKLNLEGFLFLAYWILKSFYTQSSGGLQIADYVFCASFAVLALKKMDAEGRGWKALIRTDRYFLLYVGFVAIINFIYLGICADFSFFMPVAYFVFNFLVVITFRELAKNKRFLTNFSVATFLCIAVQFVIYFLGLGRWMDGVEDGRYMGTFNDPNQLGFFVMSRFFILYIAYNHLKKQTKLVKFGLFAAFVMTGFLVVQAATTGMLLGLGVFLGCWGVEFVIANFHKAKFFFPLVLVVIFAFAFLAFGGGKLLNLDILEGSFIGQRLEEKLNKVSGENGFYGFLKDRNLLAFFEKPYYILFGFGEGDFQRFVEMRIGATSNEMHSTVLGLLYYYGFIPFLILCIWVINNLRGVKRKDICVYLALFLEALTLINHRQAALWILLILPFVLSRNKKEEGD